MVVSGEVGKREPSLAYLGTPPRIPSHLHTHAPKKVDPHMQLPNLR